MVDMSVDGILSEARVHVQDTGADRYSDAELARSLENALLELRKARPDLFIGRLREPLESVVPGGTVVLDEQFRPSLALYVAGHAQIRDEESSPDSRASALISAAREQWLLI